MYATYKNMSTTDGKYIDGIVYGTIASINGDGTPNQYIAAGSNITVSSSGGTTTIASTGGGGITSINGDTTAAQTIAAGTGVAVSSVGGTTTISAGASYIQNPTSPYTIDVNSPDVIEFTANGSYIVNLPDVISSNVFNGRSFYISKLRGTGTVTVNYSSGVVLDTLNTNDAIKYTNLYSGSGNANITNSWARNYGGSNNTVGIPVLYGGTGKIAAASVPVASSWAGWDVNGSIRGVNILGNTTINNNVTSALVVTSSRNQFGTNNSTYVWSLPDVTTLATGHTFVCGKGTGAGTLTVTTFAGTTLDVLSAGQCVEYQYNGSATDPNYWTRSWRSSPFSTTGLPITYGGTGKIAVTSVPVASTWAGWDANGSIRGVNTLPNETSAVTSALTVASSRFQSHGASGSITITLPDPSTLTRGHTFVITKRGGSGTITVNTFAGTTLDAISNGNMVTYIIANTVGADNTIWSREYSIVGNSTTGIPTNLGGTGLIAPPSVPVASTYAAWTSNTNMRANNFQNGYQVIATAASTTGLLITSPYTTRFTGSTAGKIITLPDVTTIPVLGTQYEFLNTASVTVTIQSQDSSLVATLLASTGVRCTCISLSDNTAAGWVTI